MYKKLNKGLDEEKIKEISKIKNEPSWMLEYRLDSYKKFINAKDINFGPEININFDDISKAITIKATPRTIVILDKIASLDLPLFLFQ